MSRFVSSGFACSTRAAAPAAEGDAADVPRKVPNVELSPPSGPVNVTPPLNCGEPSGARRSSPVPPEEKLSSTGAEAPNRGVVR